MGVCIVNSAVIQGVEAKRIQVEADVSNGLPVFHMGGYLSGEVREAAERVRTAIRNSGIVLPPKKIIVNLAPGSIRKKGTAFDLPIALSIMAALECKEIGVPNVIAKAKNNRHATVLKKIGVDTIIFPEKEMGVRLAKNLMSASFTDWIALSPAYSIVETPMPAKWSGKTLKELDVRRNYEVNVVGIKSGAHVEVNPDPLEVLRKDMVLILVGSNTALEAL